MVTGADARSSTLRRNRGSGGTGSGGGSEGEESGTVNSRGVRKVTTGEK